ncbi:P-loop containing nucleoside triphosphate hydrolase protein, partial [Martensiomyces pterosporus]
MVKGLADDSLCERYLFAGVLPTLAKQPRVFEVCALPVVRDLFSGYNTLLFTYGITNSGKTYTVQGTSESPGMLPCSIKAILDELGEGESDWVYQLYVSYFEVYNEMIYDLLDLTTLTTVHGGRGNEAFVDGVTEVRIRSARDLVRVLIHGQMRRSVHATGMNTGSSRSHALFQAKLVKIRRNTQIVPLSQVPAEAQASVRTMTIVDLAGSERAKRTHNQGDRLAEAGKINVSLMTLKKCLDHTGGAQLVPYNESKVTRLFQPALEGGAKTIMVVCVDP